MSAWRIPRRKARLQGIRAVGRDSGTAYHHSDLR